MKGIIQKRITALQLQCSKCTSFVDDDPDVYYCSIDRPEFPGLCDFYDLRDSGLSFSRPAIGNYESIGNWESS